MKLFTRDSLNRTPEAELSSPKHLLSCVAAAAMFAGSLIACSDRANDKVGAQLEEKLYRLLGATAVTAEGLFPIEALISIPDAKVCIQGPYMSKENFEALTKIKVQEFEQSGDEFEFWWILQKDKVLGKVKIARSKLIQRNTKLSAACGAVNEDQLSITTSTHGFQYEIRRK